MTQPVSTDPVGAGVPASTCRVLIVGGYGTFGGRLVDLLADEARLTLIVAGRSEMAAQAFTSTRAASKAKLVAAVLDRVGLLDQQLSALAPDIVVDASGPFQGYSGDPYALPRACIRAGADYIDLADAAAFVVGIDALDAEAMAAGRSVLSGASSFPCLSAAVVRHLARDLDRLDAIEAGVAPSPYAGVGLNVIRAIASYAGRPVTLIANGARATRPGFVDSRRMTVAVPGEVPLPSIRFALTEVPDLEVLARDWPDVRDIWMGAGPTPALLHRLLWVAGRLVQGRLLSSLTPFASVMHRVVNTVRWGEHRGGMTVTVTGQRRGHAETHSWHLLAEGERGPFIPSMAAEALIRARVAGKASPAGARSAHRELELEDYGHLFARRGIKTGVRHERGAAGLTPYQAILGTAYAALPPPLQELHAFEASVRYAGQARVTGASHVVTRLIARLFGFPGPATETPVTVELSRAKGVETWRRTFGRQSFLSTQERGTGRNAQLIVERFGPFAFGLALVASAGRLDLVVRRWSMFGVPLPRLLAPRSAAYEDAAQARFNFSVDIGLPVLGRLVKYEGWLVQERVKA